MDYRRQFARISRLERKTNITVRNLLNVTINVIKKIDGKRCRKHGQVNKMGYDRLQKLWMNWQPDGRNSIERHKKFTERNP